MKKEMLIGIGIVLMVLASGIAFGLGGMVGDSCQKNEDCISGSCSAGKCVAPSIITTKTCPVCNSDQTCNTVTGLCEAKPAETPSGTQQQKCDTAPGKNCAGGTCAGDYVCNAAQQATSSPTATPTKTGPKQDGDNVIFTNPKKPPEEFGSTVSVPKDILGSKYTTDWDKDGNLVITTKNIFGKPSGTWTVSPNNALGGFTYSQKDKNGNVKESFDMFQAGGNAMMKVQNKDGTSSNYLLDENGKPMKNLGAIGACVGGQTGNCYETDANGRPLDTPIVLTEDPTKGTLSNYLRGDTCFYHGMLMQYDTETQTCSGITSNQGGVAKEITVTKNGQTSEKEADCRDIRHCTATKDGQACVGDECDDIISEARTQRIGQAFQSGMRMAGTVGNFIELGRNYGWWKTDDSFLIYQKWFEDNVWLRKLVEFPDNYFCSIETAYSDLTTQGFLPTPEGKSGADIQGERYLVTEINTTTMQKTSFYRYKITFDVNGAYILKRSPIGSNGKPVYEYKTSFLVYLDGTNITGKIELSNKGTYQYGTSSVGHPLVIKSDKSFSKVCIKFDKTDDFEPHVKSYLKDNSVCNNMKDTAIPSLAEIMANAPAGAGGTGGAGGGGGEAQPYSIPATEVTV